LNNLTDDYKKLYDLYKKFGSGEDLNVVFYSTNQPVPYKDLFIYPVKTIYYMFFHSLAECFFVNKYDSGLAECMGMNPLQFLFYQDLSKKIDNANNYLPRLEFLLLMCLQKPEFDNSGEKTIKFIEKGKKQLISIDGKLYDWKDFEKMRDIICEQNCIELPDWKIHPDIRKKLKEKDELMARINKRKIASFEELIDCLMLASGYTEEYILNLSIRRFTNLLRRYDIMKNYELMTILSPNMEKKDRDNILSWNSAIPKQDQYFSKVTNLAEIEKKVNGINK
jgi:hypothetical protein